VVMAPVGPSKEVVRREIVVAGVPVGLRAHMARDRGMGPNRWRGQRVFGDGLVGFEGLAYRGIRGTNRGSARGPN